MADRAGALRRIIDWLRAGYPEGVPRQDYVALLGILHRRLTAVEVTEICDELVASSADESVTREQIEELIAGRTLQQPSPDDIARVSSRLAAGGWPLAAPDPAEAVEEADEPGAVRRAMSNVVGWLRAGYPQGVPTCDYIPLVALLRRRLTDEELADVAQQLFEAGLVPPDHTDIGIEITRITNEMPSQDDIDRVADHLRARGWPIELAD